MVKRRSICPWLFIAPSLAFLSFADVSASEELDAVTPPVFHPSAYPKSVSTCKGLNRKEGVLKDLHIRTSFLSHSWPRRYSRVSFIGSESVLGPHFVDIQTTSMSIQALRRQLLWCTAGQGFGRTGATRSLSSK